MKKYGSYTKYFNHTLSELYKDYDVYKNILNDETIEQLSKFCKYSTLSYESELINYRDSNLKEQLKNKWHK